MTVPSLQRCRPRRSALPRLSADRYLVAARAAFEPAALVWRALDQAAAVRGSAASAGSARRGRARRRAARRGRLDGVTGSGAEECSAQAGSKPKDAEVSWRFTLVEASALHARAMAVAEAEFGRGAGAIRPVRATRPPAVKARRPSAPQSLRPRHRAGRFPYAPGRYLGRGTASRPPGEGNASRSFSPPSERPKRTSTVAMIATGTRRGGHAAGAAAAIADAAAR